MADLNYLDEFYNGVDVNTTATSSSQSSSFDTYGLAALNFTANVTAVSGTNPTLDIIAQASDDGSNWSSFMQLNRFTATGIDRAQGLRLSGRYYRYKWNIGGTTPSFTFSITSTLKNYLGNRYSFLNNYQDLSLNSNSAVSSAFSAAGNYNISVSIIRSSDGFGNVNILIQSSNDNSNWDSLTSNIALSAGGTQLISVSDQAFRFFRIAVTGGANNGNTNKADVFWGSNGV